jgi:serine/threonine-protein kinase
MSHIHNQFPPGTVLLGKYRIERVLGQGGMGVVAQATHLQLNERVALKFLLPEVMNNQEVVQRFLREAQAAVKLKGEHVARVIDVGTLENGVPYMVMEYLEGGDLSELVAQSGPLPPSIAVDYALQACAALAEAHALGIVHRDIKPANFFVTRRPDGSALLKMLDFGISKAPVGVDQGLTRTQAVMGTPAYMSPEQMRSSRDVDARSDIWSLGVVIYELLAGMRPFQSESFSELCLKVAMDPLPPLQVPGAPGLGAVVERCLAKEVAHRFQNVAELAAALAPYAEHPGRAQMVVERAARTLGLANAPTAAAMVPTQPATAPMQATPTSISAGAGQMAEPPSQTRSRRTGVIIATLTAVAAAVALVIVFGTGGGSGNDSAAENQVGSPGDEEASPTRAGSSAIDAGASATKSSATRTSAADAAPATTAAKATPPDAAVPARVADERAADKRRSAVQARKSARHKRHKRRKKRRHKTSKPADDEDDLLGNRH